MRDILGQRLHTVSKRLFLILAASFAVSMAPAMAAQRGGILTMVVTPEPPTLVSFASTAVNVLKVSPKVIEGLLEYDFDMHPRPLLATSWDISADGKRYTFHLRKGVRWQDGQPFTSADVAFSLQLLRQYHPRAKSTFSNVDEVLTPDVDTVTLVLSKPAPYLIRAFSASETPILPKHLYASGDPLSNPHNAAPIGTGPFRSVKWVRGDHIEYARNDDYWDKGKPYVDGLIVKIIPDAAARTIAFESGAVQLGGDNPVPLSDIARIKANPNLGIDSRGYEFDAGVYRLEFNLDNPKLKVLAVRQAIASALDRSLIAKVVYYGYATPNPSPLTPRNRYFDPAPSPYPFDIDKANALLDKAGFPRGSDGVRFRLMLDVLPIGDQPPRTASYVRSALARIGIALTIRNEDLPTYLKRIYTSHDFDMAVNGMSNLFDPVAGVARLYTTSNYRRGVPFTNASHYSNPDIDRLFAEAAVETDENKRHALFKTMQQTIERDLPDVNLVSPDYLTVYSTRVHDANRGADGLDDSFANAWIQKP
ncbi:ABC transporter substrate-binding protein [Robbsia sp. KACC 23696]|uniref:ABC transporter substrate-binding protein n=1 Tax=Robbsia sp. KACC 23696 TaxID=3149231 RepID=UPI00325B6D37